MGCCHLVRAFKTGYKTETGADLLLRCPGATTNFLSLESAEKRHHIRLAEVPHIVTEDGRVFLTEPVMQPCGKCVGCRMADAKEWKIRNCLEMTYHQFVYFVTLTFDDPHLPEILDKPVFVYAFQRFMKRWRFAIGEKCMYFGCFEFGEHTMRPHFHLILYSRIPDLRPVGVNKFDSKMLRDAWMYGNILIEMVTPGSISYVCGYVEKKAKDVDNKKYPFPPFRLASKRPAIGFRYLEEHRLLFGQDSHVYGNFSDSAGHNHAPIPVSFKRKLKEEAYYTKLKIASEMAGENAFEVSEVVYKISNVPRLENAQEEAMLQKIENLRIQKL